MNLDEIKEQVAKVISYSQGISDPKVDELIDNWYEAKKDFIEAFGGIWYETPENVKFDLNPEEKLSRVRAFANNLDDSYDLFDLANFIEFNEDNFFDNEVRCIPESIASKLRYKKIKVGMKLFKAFKYFIDDKELLDKVQTEASRIVQEDKIEGVMRISVHPLDFLSASENTYNWRSCHALDGDYRCGNLSYMCDKSTVMVYICTKEEHILPRFPASVPWNSKKWRMLLHFSNNWDMIFAGRQYPFQSTPALEYVLNNLLQETKIHNNDSTYWSKWSDYQTNKIYDVNTKVTYSLTKKCIPIMGQLIPIERIMKDAINSRHFNDVLYSSVYIPYYSKRKAMHHYPSEWVSEQVFDDELQFDVGSEVKCLKCGKNPIVQFGTMLCLNCNETTTGYIKCSICGSYELLENIYFINDEEPVCDKCQKDFVYCSKCDRFYSKKDVTYNKYTGEILCHNCVKGE